MARTVETHFLTANLRNSMSEREVLARLAVLAAQADVLFLQEMNRRRVQWLLDQVAPGKWRVAQAKGSGWKARTVIATRRERFRRTAWGVVVTSVSNLFRSADRAFTWETVRDQRTGWKWHLACVHLVPHADDPHDPGDLTDLPRRDLVVQALDRIVAWARRHPFGQAAVFGDFNTDLRADLAHRDPDAPVERLRQAGLRNTVQTLGFSHVQDTHGRDLYDQGYLRLAAKAGRAVSHRVLPKGGSDHHPYRVTIRQTVRRGWGG